MNCNYLKSLMAKKVHLQCALEALTRAGEDKLAAAVNAKLHQLTQLIAVEISNSSANLNELFIIGQIFLSPTDEARMPW